MVVRRVGVLSAGKILGALYLLLTLIFMIIVGVVLVFSSLLGVAFGGQNFQASDVLGGLVGAVILIIFVPVFYGVVGFIGGLIAALLYNGIARMIGGIEIELEDRSRVF